MNKGFSAIELLVVALLVSILVTLISITINSEDSKRKSRDTARLANLFSLSQAIESNYIDRNNVLPDVGAKSTTRKSNLLPSGSSGPLTNNEANGWLKENLFGYLEKLPVDPLNTGDYTYRYRVDCSGLRYKLDARFEFYKDLMLNSKDQGSDNNHYEIGTYDSSHPINMEAEGC